MNMSKKIKQSIILILATALFGSCIPKLVSNKPSFSTMPSNYSDVKDTINDASTSWRKIFTDTNLVALIDTAIRNNPEVNMAFQEIVIASNEVKMRKGLLFPRVNANLSTGVDKTPRYTSEGAGNASTEMTPGIEIPEPLGDFSIGFQASWEADIWHKIRYSKQSAIYHYLATVEGRNFVVTNLVAEIANSYYELLALDNQLSVIQKSIDLQKRELEIIKVQKDAGKSNELAVKQFEAQVYNAESMQNNILQQIVENENKINFLLGRYSQPIVRDSNSFEDQNLFSVKVGLPAQLLLNRPDIKKAEHEMKSAGLDVNIARAEFLPALGFESELGYRAYKPGLLFSTPESILFSLFGKLSAPVFNRTALIAEYNNANARQKTSLYEYQNRLLNGYFEVSNQISNIENLQKTYEFKNKEVNTLKNAIDVAHDLFLSARAEYLEVLTAQKEALQSKLELIEIRKNRFNAIINVYKALGGGWE